MWRPCFEVPNGTFLLYPWCLRCSITMFVISFFIVHSNIYMWTVAVYMWQLHMWCCQFQSWFSRPDILSMVLTVSELIQQTWCPACGVAAVSELIQQTWCPACGVAAVSELIQQTWRPVCNVAAVSELIQQTWRPVCGVTSFRVDPADLTSCLWC